jgi:signal transduction histidine kinase
VHIAREPDHVGRGANGARRVKPEHRRDSPLISPVSAAPPVIDQAITEADALLETFGALLRIAQIEAGTPKHVFGPVDLSAVLDDVLEVYSPAAEEKNQTLTREIPPGISVSGDRALLTQMFANLVESAIRHSSPGACVEVELQAPANVDGPQVTIGHDGPGISGVGTRQGFPPLLSARREPFDPRQRARFGLGRRGRRFARRHYPSVRRYSRWFTGST